MRIAPVRAGSRDHGVAAPREDGGARRAALSCAWRSSATCRRKRDCTSWRRARAMRASAACRSRSACWGRPRSRSRRRPTRRSRSTASTSTASCRSLIAAEQPDVLLFAAQVPETYAYTLSVALESGLPIVASALGAFPERLAGVPRSTTVPWDAPARSVERRAAGSGRAWVAALAAPAKPLVARHQPDGTRPAIARSTSRRCRRDRVRGRCRRRCRRSASTISFCKEGEVEIVAADAAAALRRPASNAGTRRRARSSSTDRQRALRNSSSSVRVRDRAKDDREQLADELLATQQKFQFAADPDLRDADARRAGSAAIRRRWPAGTQAARRRGRFDDVACDAGRCASAGHRVKIARGTPARVHRGHAPSAAAVGDGVVDVAHRGSRRAGASRAGPR